MQAVAVVGFKNSGKTTLVARLAAELGRRGRPAAVAKFCHHRMDKADTDTGRLLEVSPAVAGLHEEETALFWPGKRYLPDLLPLMPADVLVVEGGKSLGWLPRVLVLREPSEAEALDRGLALGTWGEVQAPGLPRIPDMAALADLVLARGFALPGLDCGECGRDDCAGLAREIVAGEADADHCRAAGGSISVTVNGRPLGMNAFVGRVVAGAIRGLLGEFKGYAPGTVEIRLEESPKK